MVVSTLEPWTVLPCSNTWLDDPVQKNVQLSSLTWTWADDNGYQRRSSANRRLSQFNTIGGGNRLNQYGAQVSPVTTILTFRHTTLLPSVTSSPKQPIPPPCQEQSISTSVVARSLKPARAFSATTRKPKALHQTQNEPTISELRPRSRGEMRQPIQETRLDDGSRQGRSPTNYRRSPPFVVLREAFEWQSAREERYHRLYKASNKAGKNKLSRNRNSLLHVPAATTSASITPTPSPRLLFYPGSSESIHKHRRPSNAYTPEVSQKHKPLKTNMTVPLQSDSPRTSQNDIDFSSTRSLRSTSSRKKSPLEDLSDRGLRLVFWKFADAYGKIDRSRLGLALNVLGYTGRTVTESAIAKCAEKVSSDQSSELGLTAFEEFCVLFDAEYTHGAVKSFRDADLDGNGVLTPSEVKLLLEHHGVTVIPGTVQELLDEVGQECPGAVTLDEWEELVYIIRARGAFTQKEAEELRNLFCRYDFNGNGKIDRRECASSLSYLALLQDKHRQEQTLAEIMRGFNDYEDQEILELEFFQLVRKFREMEVKEISDLFSSLDYGAGTLAIEGLITLLSEIGFKMPSEEVVMESARDLGLSCEKNGFFFDDVLMIAEAFRKCEGFSKDELKEFRQVFTNNDLDQNGEIDAVELGSVLRWLGSPVDVEKAQDLMETIDMDKSGFVDFEEFVKVMRCFREGELESLERVYEISDADRSGGLNFHELKFLILTLGYQVTSAHTKLISESFSGMEASFAECVVLMKAFREEFRKTVREGYGFSKKDLNTLRRKFDRLDRQSDGAIDITSLKAFVADDSSDAVKMIPSEELEKILQRFHLDSKVVDFHEFLHFWRMVVDQGDYQLVSRQRTIAEEAGFNAGEVMEIRRIFKMIDHDSARSLDFHLLEHLFADFMPSTGKHIAKLWERLCECDEDKNSRIDFREFIAFMRKLMDGAHEGEDIGSNVDVAQDGIGFVGQDGTSSARNSLNFLDGLASHVEDAKRKASKKAQDKQKQT